MDREHLPFIPGTYVLDQSKNISGKSTYVLDHNKYVLGIRVRMLISVWQLK